MKYRVIIIIIVVIYWHILLLYETLNSMKLYCMYNNNNINMFTKFLFENISGLY